MIMMMIIIIIIIIHRDELFSSIFKTSFGNRYLGFKK